MKNSAVTMETKQNSETKGKTNEVVYHLNKLLADYQVFYQNLRGLHWNVKGKMFFLLHTKFEEFYKEAAETADELAERVLTLGGSPYHTFEDYLNNAGLKPVKNVSNGEEAVKVVKENSVYLLKKFNQVLAVSEEANDEATNALMSDLVSETKKRVWMLNAFLAE